MKTLIVLIVLSFVFACGLTKTENTQNTPEGRKKYVRSLMIVKIGGQPAMFDATDADNKTLSADLMDDVTEKDCSDFAKSKITEEAVKIGFNKLTCRGGLYHEGWSFSLQ